MATSRTRNGTAAKAVSNARLLPFSKGRRCKKPLATHLMAVSNEGFVRQSTPTTHHGCVISHPRARLWPPKLRIVEKVKAQWALVQGSICPRCHPFGAQRLCYTRIDQRPIERKLGDPTRYVVGFYDELLINHCASVDSGPSGT